MFRAVVAVAAMLIALPASAFTIDWDELAPTVDLTEPIQNYADVDGSGVDITLEISQNMWDQGAPAFYDALTAPVPEAAGSIRITNDRDALIEETSLTVSFSEAILIDSFSVFAISIVGASEWQENVTVEARDGNGDLVFATNYGTSTPGLVSLDVDGDASYRTAGIRLQNNDEYGDAEFAYTGAAVSSLQVRLRITAPGDDPAILGFGSIGIGDVEFSSVVPEPATTALLGLALAGLLGLRRRA